MSSGNVLSSVPEPVNSILIMRQDRIGDMIMTLPLIRSIRDTNPGIRIGIVASESSRIILKYEKGFDIVTYRKDPPGFISSLVEAWNLNPDVVVDMHMHDSTTSMIYAVFSGAKWKMHVDRENRLPFNVRVDAPRDGHIMDAFAGLLSGLGRKIETVLLRREVSLSVKETDFAEEFWRRSGASPENCAAVNISAGSENRRWGTDRYALVCGKILKLGLTPLLLYSPGDSSSAETIFDLEPGVLLSPVTPDILHLAALMRRVSLLVSPDTSVIHLAASSGIPVVGMYLPFDPSLPKWYPWRVRNRVIISGDERSLDSIQPDTIMDAVKSLIKEGSFENRF